MLFSCLSGCCPYLLDVGGRLMPVKWDGWRGSLDGRPTFWEKRLFSVRGWRLSLHKFVSSDDPGCFHSHPAWAVRIVVWGGYVEEIFEGYFRNFRVGRVGVVAPWLIHRTDRLLRGPSYSIWIRGPKIAPIRIYGQGWENQSLGSPPHNI